MALVALQQASILKFVVSQNVDNLHLKSGLPRSALAELHGNVFKETCEACNKEFIGTKELSTIGFKHTGNKCEVCIFFLWNYKVMVCSAEDCLEMLSWTGTMLCLIMKWTMLKYTPRNLI